MVGETHCVKNNAVIGETISSIVKIGINCRLDAVKAVSRASELWWNGFRKRLRVYLKILDFISQKTVATLTSVL